VLATPVPLIDVGKINQAARQHEKEIQPIAAALRVEGDSVVVNLILRNTDKRTFEDTARTSLSGLTRLEQWSFHRTRFVTHNQSIQPFKRAGI
jgi:hypothetical protein